jgi:hypothetical protein
VDDILGGANAWENVDKTDGKLVHGEEGGKGREAKWLINCN